MRRKGYVLIELLLASMLTACAVAGLFFGLMQGIKTERAVRATRKMNDPLILFSLRVEKTLRNAVVLKDYPFRGEKDEFVFPISEMTKAANGETSERLLLIRYFYESGQLKESRAELTSDWISKETIKKTVLTGLSSAQFQYAYQDEKDRQIFLPVWMEEPYFGLPRAVKIILDSEDWGAPMVKLVSIPQGRWGYPQQDIEVAVGRRQ